jgi:hypothetical protein
MAFILRFPVPLSAAACWIEHAPGRRWILEQFRSWTDRPRRKIATAVRADAPEFVLNAIAAKRAFEGADHRVGGCRRQILVAALATRAQFQHESPPVPAIISASAVESDVG